MTRFLLICLGGAIGTGVRYLTTIWAAKAYAATFPIGTLIVNIVGSFLAAGVAAIALARLLVRPA